MIYTMIQRVREGDDIPKGLSWRCSKIQCETFAGRLFEIVLSLKRGMYRFQIQFAKYPPIDPEIEEMIREASRRD